MVEPAAGAFRAAFAPYRVLLTSRIRSQLAYPTSFALDVLNSVAYAVLELLEVYLIFHSVDLLGGLDRSESLLVFSLGRLGFALADVLVGQLDTVPTYIRAGTLDVLLVRPLPVLAQLAVDDVQLRRLGRGTLYLGVLVVSLAVLPIAWTPARLVLVPVTLIGSTVLFAAFFVAAGAVQFRLMDGGDATHAFTYGGAYVASYSGAVLPTPLRAFFTGVVPALFAGYLPALALLGRDGPAGWPGWLGWLGLPVGLLAMTGALALWRNGLRHYRGGGG